MSQKSALEMSPIIIRCSYAGTSPATKFKTFKKCHKNIVTQIRKSKTFQLVSSTRLQNNFFLKRHKINETCYWCYYYLKVRSCGFFKDSAYQFSLHCLKKYSKLLLMNTTFLLFIIILTKNLNYHYARLLNQNMQFPNLYTLL